MLTALVLIPLVLAGIFLLPPDGLLVLGVGIAFLAGLEWASLIHISRRYRVLYALLLAGLTALLTRGDPLLVAGVALLWWLLVLAELPVFRPQTEEPVFRAANGLAGVVILAPPLALLVGQVQREPWLAVAVLAAIWASDIGAWGVGRWLGRHRMAPHISPGKTWEGLAGGAVLAGAAGGGLAWGLPAPVAHATATGVAIAVALVGQVGDMAESMFKRRAGVKDSGTWLPGHGGLLDRIDSLTAAVPVYAVCLWGLGL